MQTVEAEDRARGLYTLQPAPTSPLKYPNFSGKDTECFFSFKENLRCFNSNKVHRADQPAKLRELLTGHPLALVPESVKTIEKAFYALDDRYEYVERVLGLRVAELEKLGTVPERYCDQFIFFINLEAKVQDIHTILTFLPLRYI
jgi:hypothetical protein